MSSTIFGRGGKRKRGKKDDDNSENSDVDDDFADEATDNDPEVENDESDLDGIIDPEDIAEDGSNKADSFNGKAFDAASIINLNSRTLADVLADKDLAPSQEAPRNTITLPPASAFLEERVLTEEDWDMA
jgi:hypothetical protein